jgi:heme exporter protein CcmD
MNLHDMLYMGGYAAYVWTTYAITLMVFGFNIYASLREKKRAQQKVRQFLMSANES